MVNIWSYWDTTNIISLSVNIPIIFLINQLMLLSVKLGKAANFHTEKLEQASHILKTQCMFTQADNKNFKFFFNCTTFIS